MPALNILYIAYPLLTVSAESAGGAEQVLWTLERELACRDVRTTVAASAGSRVTGELFSTGDPCSRPDDYDRRNQEHQENVLDLVRQRAGTPAAFDLIHDMSGRFWRRAGEIDIPVLATVHLPRSFYSPDSFYNVAANVSFNCVSHAQSVTFSDLLGMIGVVPNGIALDRFAAELYTNGSGKGLQRQGLLWLGRICEEKAPHLALEIAHRAGLPITLAGQVYPFSYHQQYFEREIVSRLQHMQNASFVPSPSFEHKRQLLREALALLITSQTDETSSLVAMEAAASGTPVIAFRRGALPEVVREGVTGSLVDDIDSAVTACHSTAVIDSEACIQHACANFSGTAMADAYFELYERIVRTSVVRGLAKA